MLDLLLSPNAWLALLTLTVLEIVLGIDNIIFLSLAANKLPPPRRPTARRIGLMLALGMRIVLLSSIAWIISLVDAGRKLLGRRPVLARPDLRRRRHVPAHQEHARNPRHGRGRRA